MLAYHKAPGDRVEHHWTPILLTMVVHPPSRRPLVVLSFKHDHWAIGYTTELAP
jgi:hypothetical protein